MVTTADFPQADRLLQVGKVAEAVAAGHRTDTAIENFIGLDSHGRQGRYYRLAANILGLVTNERNYSSLTILGAEYASLSTAAARQEFLARCLLETPVFAGALQYIRQKRPSDNQLKAWFRQFYPGTQNTADRRFATFEAYLRDADLLNYAGAGLTVKRFSGALAKEYTKLSDGIAGKPVRKLVKEATEATNQKPSIIYEVDAQKQERANQIHWRLITAKAAFLEGRNLPAMENLLIDLFSTVKDDTVIYEMKSLSGKNLASQLRKAVAQLYEYRYIFASPKARLCMVTNAPVSKADEWMVEYLAQDRAIAYEWTENFNVFECENGSKELLGGFSPR